MKVAARIVCVSTLFTLGSSLLAAQQTREQAVAGMKKVTPNQMDSSYTKAAPYAQQLVDEELARHSEVILLAIHAAPPGHKDLIIASNFGRIGKIGDEDDLRCERTGKSNLEVNGAHFEDEVVMKDKSGKTVGAVGVVFNYKPGTDKDALAHIADQIRDEMQAKTPHKAVLFGPAE